MVETIIPDWPAPHGVRALSTTRLGGVSAPPWTTLNLGEHVGDDPAAVQENRRRLAQLLPGEPVWLHQVHGARCVDAVAATRGETADAICSRKRGVVCAVQTADCLPVLLCDADASVVAVAHAGWRGLAAGVIESAVGAMAVPGERLMAWLGPAIGPDAFEVGGEVRAAFVARDAAAAAAFRPVREGKWLCDIYRVARLRLSALGIDRVSGGGFCTVGDRERFFSYRRDGTTGRMASLIWLE